MERSTKERGMAVNRFIRTTAALVLRRVPRTVRGRGRAADFVNHTFPAGQSEQKVWAPMCLGYKMLIDLRSETEYPSYYLGDYDTAAIQSLRGLFAPDWVVLDVGANIGFWTIPMASALSSRGCLHAFEPLASNFKRLGENVRENRLDHVVRLHQMGLSNQNAELRLSLREDFLAGAETGNAAIVINLDDERFECTNITVVPFDEIAPSLGINRLDFVKVDIEGHEDRFLAGARRSIQRYRPLIYLEINEPYYERCGVDPTGLFEQWQREVDYESLLDQPRRGWTLKSIRERKGVIDNVLFVPSEKAAFVIKQLRG